MKEQGFTPTSKYFGVSSRSERGFTLIELLVVVAIVGLLGSIVMSGLNNARVKSRDARRLSDMQQIVKALQLYYSDNNQYPGNTDNDCGGWDAGKNGGIGANDPFITPLQTAGHLASAPADPTATGNCGGYTYYRYPAGYRGCDSARGNFFVLGVRDMETSSRPHSDSPGWSCPSRDWQAEFDWVTGDFER